MSLMKIKEALQIAKNEIHQKGLEENAGLLLVEHLSGINNRTELFLKMDESCIDEQLFYTQLQRYLNGEPMQYVLNRAWFLNEEYYVDSRVLIPRMETEELVLKAIEILKTLKHPLIFDVCTGSGCIAISLKKHVSDIHIMASDISRSAIEVAKMNQERLLVDDIEWLVSDLFQNYPAMKADLIISNPPYIDAAEKINELVLKNEPYIALVPPSGNGLEMYEKLFKELPSHLKEGGYFMAEFGYQQKDELEKMVKKYLPSSKIEFYKDISNKDRYFVLRYFE